MPSPYLLLPCTPSPSLSHSLPPFLPSCYLFFTSPSPSSLGYSLYFLPTERRTCRSRTCPLACCCRLLKLRASSLPFHYRETLPQRDEQRHSRVKPLRGICQPPGQMSSPGDTDGSPVAVPSVCSSPSSSCALSSRPDRPATFYFYCISIFPLFPFLCACQAHIPPPLCNPLS